MSPNHFGKPLKSVIKFHFISEKNSETSNFLFSKSLVMVQLYLKNVYDQIFEWYVSLGLQARTSAFSCSDDDVDYDTYSVQGRPIPWTVRVYFESENSFSGKICSGKYYLDNKIIVIIFQRQLLIVSGLLLQKNVV